MTVERTRTGWTRWWWVAALILVPVILGSTLSVALLLILVDAGTVADQIELIKTGLAVGAGTGGAVALVLAGRRQWSTEQAHRLSERSADDARHDASERRITDLYSKAADQLGSEKAAVRLAGIYSLERLAQDNPALQQTVVNLLCAYLRMPPESASEQEIEVRAAAQRVFSTHLNGGGFLEMPPDTFWPRIDLDLTGAELHYLDLQGAWLRNGRFGDAEFLGKTWFDGAEFEGDAIFGGATFEKSASFRSVRFHAEARFRDAEFGGPADFQGASFGAPSFTGATFAEPPVISDSVELD